ncbi:putative adhesin [Streptomyces sp. H27-D2]|uniref:putative adhesin n=1 Tax=Streptomyces sp. H27-D2 TaxID=3046304 RepID=UPI002DB6ECAB|nr:hypothetical protein [Streptomyces sp. H27-D2]MEC4016981.1 hypothetical protein [Streptomyces sp. H27-D2]
MALAEGMIFGGALGGALGGASSFADDIAHAGGTVKMLKGVPTSFGNLGRSPLLKNAPFGPMASRGSGTDMPAFEQIKKAVSDSNPQISSRRWPDDDGRYYASRVISGGRADGESVLAGHGYIEVGAGELTVPPGSTISFYVPHGERIPGLNGVAVEGGSYPGAALETFHPGDSIPNYTLAPPESTGAGGFTVYENSTTVAKRTYLGDLLKLDMGNVHWAACRELK